MIQILTVGRAGSFEAFNHEVDARDDAWTTMVDAGAAALDMLSKTPVDLVVVDEALADMSGLELARQVAVRWPLTAVALVSTLEGEDFHETTEGLGILAQLPPRPGRTDARRLLETLVRVMRMSQEAGA